MFGSTLGGTNSVLASLGKSSALFATPLFSGSLRRSYTSVITRPMHHLINDAVHLFVFHNGSNFMFSLPFGLVAIFLFSIARVWPL